MSEETAQEAPEDEQGDDSENEATDTEEASEDAVEAVEATTEQVGTKFVEFDDPAVAARFKHIYGNMKENERLISIMADDNKKLMDKLDSMDRRQAEAEVEGRVTVLKDLKKTALEEADSGRVVEIDDELMKLRVPPEKTPAPAPDTAVQEENPLTTDQMAAISAWGQEMDTSGNYKRPWAQPSHPLHAKAAGMAAAVLNDPNMDDVHVCLHEALPFFTGSSGIATPLASRAFKTSTSPSPNVLMA